MRIATLLCLSLPLLPAVAMAEADNSLAAAIAAGKASVAVRGRYEHVDDDGTADDADALTARLRLNYRTGRWNGWSGFAEFDHVFHLLSDFNSGAGTSPGKTSFATVADPDGSDLNQLYFEVQPREASILRIGRQRLLLNNQRFVGGVGWRQNEQTYDGLSYETRLVENLTVQYGYVGYVRRIFGESVPAGKHNVDAHLLNASYTISDSWSLSPYYYYIDNQDAAAFSTATAGARLTGTLAAGDNNKVRLAAEFATQSDAANNPTDYRADYALLDVSFVLQNGLALGLAYESLSGDATATGMSFRTPLATLHAFQGWADKFLVTPAQGINDVYASVKFNAGKWRLAGIYHDFSAESGGADFGTEFDVSAARALTGNYSVLFKGAFFDSDSPAYDDTTKFWIMFSANY